MKKTNYTQRGEAAREVLTGMVVSTDVLAQVAARWDDKRGLFKDEYANTIGQWCVDHYNRYHEAPSRKINSLFEAWATSGQTKERIEIVESFLESLSSRYVKLEKQISPQYVIDRAGELFTRVVISRIIEAVEGELEANRPDKASAILKAFNQVQLGAGAGVHVLTDVAVLESAFAQEQKPLIKLKGAAGNFFGHDLARDAFVSLEGPEKVGKTRWLMWLAWQAMLQGHKVAFFEVGDLSQNQIMLRFATLAARRPYAPTEDRPIQYPTFLEPARNADDNPTASFKELQYDEWLTRDKAQAALFKVMDDKGVEAEDFKLFVYPNFSISIYGVQSVLKDYERRGWVPDVVVIDYMDILASSTPGAVESREQVNTTWKMARSLSQSFHCLVLGATQTNAQSYDTDIIDMQHFSEDKRKRAHVTASFGLNQTVDEKERNMTRVNVIVRRENYFNRKKVLHCAGCPEIGNPCILSTF